MGILDFAGKVAGAVAAVEGVEKLDSDAGLLEKGAAAIAGFEGVGAIENLVEGHKDAPQDDQTQQADDGQADGQTQA